MGLYNSKQCMEMIRFNRCIYKYFKLTIQLEDMGIHLPEPPFTVGDFLGMATFHYR
jgi:hypothetical protein